MNGPQFLYLMRHAEKPANVGASPTGPAGVALDGEPDRHSLTPRGWQRSGALAVLFTRPPRPGTPALRTPDRLLSPDYGTVSKTTEHRAYQTLLGLAAVIDRPIDSPHPLGEEAAVATAALQGPSNAVLICWEHEAIPAIAHGIPTDPATPVPDAWPDGRFDLIWQFTRTATAPPTYAFQLVLQDVLGGDENASTPT